MHCKITGCDETPLVRSHLHFIFVDLWRLAVLLILAIHRRTSIRGQRGAQLTHGFSSYSLISEETTR